MEKELSAEFIEIFGSTTVEESLVNPVVQRQPPKLPIEDDLFLSPVTGAADQLCRRLEDDAFIAELVGPTEDEAQKGITPIHSACSAGRELLTMAKIISTRVAKRHAAVAASAPERCRRIHAIVEQARRAAPESIRGSDGWDRLAASCERYVATAIMELA
jgi:hypothetical protein